MAAGIDGTYGVQTGYGGEVIRLENGRALYATYSDVGGGSGKAPVEGRYRVEGHLIQLDFPAMAPRRLVHEITPSAEFLFDANKGAAYRLQKFSPASMKDLWTACPSSRDIQKTAPATVFSSTSGRPLAELTADRQEIQLRAAKSPNDAALQQQLSNARNAEEKEIERLYTEGLIAYSQGRRDEAVRKWKELLSARPDHRGRLMKDFVQQEQAGADTGDRRP
jgi:hypothetical protein